MAAAITSSPCSSFTLPTKLLHPSVSQAPKRPYPHQCFRFLHLTTPYKTPTITVCHGKLDGSAGEEADEIGGEVFFDDNDLIEDESDDDETESSIDLLIRFFQSMFKKVSKRAKKASRSILPSVISPQLVSFAVDGILLLAALSIVKAFLEVVCTLGSTVFSVILLLRVIWAAISYFQSNETNFNQGGSSFGSTQPVA
ncbi:hypothetical protein P3X46_003011 [Hevea brasiliensis]|uniref:Protein SHORT HYPOCOTYL IN WHITE LIGHT 1 n=1 Tax=Hevea brasiliensis TaxID=3981 RepID=A0ABQ9N8M0_HEVBR|nr:protein SHORT HYPOCOTYL IN WHITE LIGHT 1 [Hevea brasiliensis]KAJ9187570.1 hypothetical protein P3X46_003011 [Hevea brasiliensis]